MTTATHTWATTPTRTVDVGGVPFAYRELGTDNPGVPVVLLHHLTAVLDDWDPRLLDGLAAQHHVIAVDNRGVGSTGGKVPSTVDAMGRDVIAFLRAMGHEKVDLLGFSLGGGVAQMVALQAPELVRRLVLAGTAPKGGGGVSAVTGVFVTAYLKAALTRSDPRNFLFFPRTTEGRRAAAAYLDRLDERTHDLDDPISLQARINQLRAIRAAGLADPDDLSRITVPVLVANGDDDLMVASANSHDMARRLPDAKLVIYPRSGHGGIFQHHEQFVPEVLTFLADR
ncbi:alpha/beta fold hydrolase [Rhodococcus aerolatus]